MQEIISFLEENKFGNLATAAEGQPYVRPFEYGFKTDDGVFFYTSDDKAVFSQLQSNPKASFCATNQDLDYVQLTGDVKFTEDEKYKDMMIKNSKSASKIYQSADNPKFKVFYMAHGHAMLHKHNGEYVCDEQF